MSSRVQLEPFNIENPKAKKKVQFDQPAYEAVGNNSVEFSIDKVILNEDADGLDYSKNTIDINEDTEANAQPQKENTEYQQVEDDQKLFDNKPTPRETTVPYLTLNRKLFDLKKVIQIILVNEAISGLLMLILFIQNMTVERGIGVHSSFWNAILLMCLGHSIISTAYVTYNLVWLLERQNIITPETKILIKLQYINDNVKSNVIIIHLREFVQLVIIILAVSKAVPISQFIMYLRIITLCTIYFFKYNMTSLERQILFSLAAERREQQKNKQSGIKNDQILSDIKGDKVEFITEKPTQDELIEIQTDCPVEKQNPQEMVNDTAPDIENQL